MTLWLSVPGRLRTQWSKMAALVTYGYQAVAALALVLVLARVLDAADYARFSLTLAAAQFGAIFAFEWVRIAATRFYPGPDPTGAPLQKAALGAGFAGSAVIGGLASLGAAFGGAPLEVVLTGAAVALGQGLTDLYLTFVRYRGDLGAFARLQGLRATALLCLGVAGAALTDTATGALLGIGLTHAILVVVALITDPHVRNTPWCSASLSLLRNQIAYGAPAAGASILHLATALIARYAIIAVAPGAAGAGTLLALDLLQRPFAVVTTALNAILYPQVVRAYDRGGFPAARSLIWRLYGIELAVIVVLMVTILSALSWPEARRLLVPDVLDGGFAASAAIVTVLFAARTTTLNIVPIPLHLARRSVTILALAAVDAPLFLGTLAVFYYWSEMSANTVPLALAISSICVAVVGIHYSMRLARSRRHLAP